MTITELEILLQELPKEYGIKSHEAEVARYAFDVAQQQLAMKEAGLTLILSATTLDGESGSAKTLRIKNKVIVDLHEQTMEVLRFKSNWKKAELEADIIDKKIILLCKQCDLHKSEMIQIGMTEKTGQGKQLFTPTVSKMGRE